MFAVTTARPCLVASVSTISSDAARRCSEIACTASTPLAGSRATSTKGDMLVEKKSDGHLFRLLRVYGCGTGLPCDLSLNLLGMVAQISESGIDLNLR